MKPSRGLTKNGPEHGPKADFLLENQPWFLLKPAENQLSGMPREGVQLTPTGPCQES